MTPLRSLALLAGLAGALLGGCSGGDPRQGPQAEAPATFEDLRARGEARLAERDWTGALAACEQALRLRPDDVELRYLTGVALSQLDRASDAEVVFRWVVDHSPPDREEARMAADWLRASEHLRVRGASAPEREEPREGGGRVEGRTAWGGLSGETPPRLQILLTGDGPGPARRYGVSVRLGDRYAIPGVPPGFYRLAAQVGMTRLWDTTVTVEEGKATTADLLPATSIAPASALDRTPS